MIIEKITLPELFNIAQGEGERKAEHSSPQNLGDAVSAIGAIGAIWREKRLNVCTFPSAVVIDDSRRRSFLAWVATYLPQLRPFTAFCRVLSPQALDACARREAETDMPSLGLLEEACLGLVFGELATLTNGSLDFRNVSFAGCGATLSYAVMRTLALGEQAVNVREIATRWSHARVLMKNPGLPLDAEQVVLPWSVLLELRDLDPNSNHMSSHEYKDLRIACEEIFQSGKISLAQWRRLTNGWNTEGAVAILDKPREERVVTVRRLIESLAMQSTFDRTTRAFLAGYLVNQIGPGSFEHFPMLLPFHIQLPGVLMWYGLCAGLRRKGFLRNLSGSLGRRILREAVRRESFLDQPQCDVSLAELEVLTGSGIIRGDLRITNLAHVVIELSPCINTIVRLLPTEATEEARVSAPASSQRKLFDDEPLEMRRALSELWTVLNELDGIKERISKYVAPTEQKKTKRKG
ncbi:MAG: hypothetical protein WCH39_19400 [Schlesneria sp.]